jgi:DNA-binding LytR/AlgR family response regulator
VVTIGDEIVTKEKISKISSRLPPYFKRIHRSFIVNSQKVSSYNSEFIKVGNSQIPISRTYKKDVITYLNKI